MVTTLRSVEQDFYRLATEWRRDIGLSADLASMVEHPAYEAIIALGPSVVPVLLGELAHQPDQWFWALREITGEDPAENVTTFSEAVDAWLAWGERHGYTSWLTVG